MALNPATNRRWQEKRKATHAGVFVYVTLADHARLKKLAEECDVTMSQFVRWALNDSLRSDGEAELQQVREVGRHGSVRRALRAVSAAVAVALLSVSCAAKAQTARVEATLVPLVWADEALAENTVQLHEEEATDRQVCVQWAVEDAAGVFTYPWRCVTVGALRGALFEWSP